MSNTNSVLTQGTQVETSKTRVKPIGGDFAFFPESFEAEEERVTPIPDFVSQAFEPQEFDPISIPTSCLQGPGYLDFNSSKEVVRDKKPPMTDPYIKAFATENDDHLNPDTNVNTSIFSTPQIITATTNLFSQAAEVTGKVAVDTVKESFSAGFDILKEVAGIVEKSDASHSTQPKTEAEQNKLIEGQFVRSMGEALQGKLDQAGQETQVKIALGMVGKPELTEEDLAMLGSNPNLRREQRNTISNYALYSRKTSEQQKLADQAEMAAETQQVQKATGNGLNKAGSMDRAAENTLNHYSKSTS